MKLIFEKSKPGRRAAVVPKPDLPVPEVPEELRRRRAPRLPELAEPEIVRHFTALADRTFGVDTGFYPLGSCTMKHNPRVNERVVALPGFRDLHPLQEEDGAQGALELMWRLQEILAEVCGLDRLPVPGAAPTHPAPQQQAVQLREGCGGPDLGEVVVGVVIHRGPPCTG